MKNTVYRFLFLWLLLAVPTAGAWAQAPAWQALVTLPPGSMSFTTVQKVAVAANGDVVMVGTLFGQGRVGSFTLTAPNGGGIFLAKWRPATSSFVWATTIGGGFPKGLALSGAAIYVAGEFSAPTLVIGTTTLINQGIQSNNEEGYVAKFVDTGTTATFAWAQAIAGEGKEFVGGLAVQGSALYLCGTSLSANLMVGGTTLAHPGRGLYVAKLLDAGPAPTLVWCQEGGPPSEMWGRGLAVQGNAVYVVGYFGSRATATIGGITLANAYPGTLDAYVAKLTDAGSAVSVSWAVRAGGVGPDQLSNVAVAGGRVYVSGEFGLPTATFGAFTLTNANTGQYPVASTDVLVACLRDLGGSATVDWALGVGGPGDEEAGALVAAGASVFVAGGFASPTAAFGPTTLTNATTPANYYDRDVFVARCDSAAGRGVVGWAVRAGGTGSDYARGALLVGGQLLVTGTLSLPAAFGPLVAAGTVGTAGFLAALPAATPTATGAAAPAAWAGLSLSPNPARTAATVRLPAVPGAARATLTVLDALGRAVRSQQVALPAAGTTADVPLAGLAPGLYRLRVVAGPWQASRALVVE